MKKAVRVFLAVLLPWSIIVGTGESVVAAADQKIVSQESSNQVEETLPDPIDENLNEEALTAFVSEQIDDGTEIEFTEEGVYINENFYTPEEFDHLLESIEEPTDLSIGILADSTSNSGQSRAFFIPAVGWASVWVYGVPGVGQIAVVATAAVGVTVGTYILGKAIIKSGHWAYNKIRSHVNSKPRPKTKKKVQYNYSKSVTKQEYTSYTYGIPKSLLDGTGRVKLKNMNQKVHRKGAPPAWRDPKTGYTKEKDMSGHAGKEWKIRDKSGKRKASTDGNGKIISK